MRNWSRVRSISLLDCSRIHRNKCSLQYWIRWLSSHKYRGNSSSKAQILSNISNSSSTIFTPHKNFSFSDVKSSTVSANPINNQNLTNLVPLQMISSVTSSNLSSIETHLSLLSDGLPTQSWISSKLPITNQLSPNIWTTLSKM